MVKFISYIIAVLITAFMAVSLYPLCGIGWIFSIIGKISGNLFNWTNKIIKGLWADINGTKVPPVSLSVTETKYTEEKEEIKL